MKNWLIGKDPDAGKIEGRRRRGWQRMRWLDGITDSWTWVWVSSRSWWWTGRPGVLQSMGLQSWTWLSELNWLIIVFLMLHIPFPHSSVGKESTCDAGDPGSIPGLGRSAGEGIGYPLQYSWASFVAQLVKNPPTMWEVQTLGWEDPLEKGKAAHSSNLAWRIPWNIQVHGVAKSWTQLSNFHSLTHSLTYP